MSCNKESKAPVQPEDFRQGFTGEYHGVLHKHHSEPEKINDTLWIMSIHDKDFQVDATVSLEGDSSVNVDIFNGYSKNMTVKLQDSLSGFHQNGGGSSYEEKSITFKGDSLILTHIQACGQPCRTSYSLKAKK